MGLNGLLGLAKDALAAQAFALDVVGQNVSNVNTPGYVRRDANLETLRTGGVVALGVDRAVDRFVDARVYDATGYASGADARDQQLAGIEALFNDAQGTGLGSAIGALFGSFAALSASPTDPATRANVIDRARAFASQLNTAASSIVSQRRDMLSQAQGVASQASDLAQQIAQLNAKIKSAEDTGADASDLRDQQGKLVGQLSDLVDVHTFVDGNNQLVVRAAGTTLVEGSSAGSFSVSTDASDSMRLVVQRQGGAPLDVTDHLTGGKLAGLKEARDTDATAVMAKLDQLTSDVGNAVNAQHAAGYGADGSTGQNVFTGTSSALTIALDPGLDGHPERVAASSTAAGLPGGSDNATALAALASGKIANGGTRTAAEAYSDIVGDVGQRKASAAQESDMRGAMKSQAQAMRSSEEGVSMDEEMVNLSKYQRAYEAASKLVNTADQLLQELMGEVGK